MTEQYYMYGENFGSDDINLWHDFMIITILKLPQALSLTIVYPCI